MNYIFYAFLWITWCTFHSVLISHRFTEMLELKLGDGYRYYRLFYNCFSAVTLLIPLWYGWQLKGTPVFRLDGIVILLRFALLSAALYFFIAGARKYDMSRFIGVFQAVTGKRYRSIAVNDELDTSGVHQITRHPWYTGGILLLWTYQSAFDPQSIISSFILTLYFVIGAALEERKLILVFGHQYRQYQQDVSMLVPWKWIKQKTRH